MDTRNLNDGFRHTPVLLAETLDFLQPEPNQTLLDVTFGRGGHCEEILEKTAPDGFCYAIDADADAVEFCTNIFEPKFAGRIKIFHSWFSDLAELLEDKLIMPCDMILADLGLSSPQIDDAKRGFSYTTEAPLDMRFNNEQGITALQLLVETPEQKLANIFWEFGEERFSRQIAREIKLAIKSKSLHTTLDLAAIIERTVRKVGKGRIRDTGPAPRRVFQALRIAVNRELDELNSLLKILPSLLRSKGRAAIISFHSLEDRQVKIRFKELSATGEFRILTKKPVTASELECRLNSRAASAKLRAIEKL